MLAADKLLLQSNLRQNAIKLKEKEFTLHHENFSNVGTQAALLAGFTVTGLIEFSMPVDANRILQFAYYVLTVLSLGMNLSCVSSTTALSVFGTGLALRGPDGSMVRAVDGMYAERSQIFATFGIGLFATLGAAACASCIVMHPEAAFVSVLSILFCVHRIYTHGKRIFAKFRFEEDEGVNFDDILSAPLVDVFARTMSKPKPKRGSVDNDQGGCFSSSSDVSVV
mmetsp:Transcript_56605/g.113346  ORF Transcript_56605/g.113346 Transcript_56605/m.113346 type:complete len:225 (-) Transcript_56605:204-878(-)|eukprot:CAMPEP_0171594668 /NCGR_PEP_ID=MMETSP0990-20121206/835_1 /TAXON_ID=483369 /ORGANISM="non described non described, Strain CCMP2098" /LENGTH=224 /DNA_ID=CAMNT_0012155419 /DNA_START=96 /DNA_END=770 /DNA_ORIENTATION=-